MEFVPVRDLHGQPGTVWRKLHQQGDLVLTSRGKPIAVLVNIEQGLEQTLAEIRRARARLAVAEMRRTAQVQGLDRLPTTDLEAEIQAARRERSGQ